MVGDIWGYGAGCQLFGNAAALGYNGGHLLYFYFNRVVVQLTQ